MTNISPVPESKVTFFKSSGHKHDGVTSSIIDTSKYSIFDFGTDITTGNRDRSRELTRTSNQNRFNQYIANFISTQILAPAGIELLENSVRGIHIGADEVTANNIAANTITANEIASNTITANNIAANTITANEIASNTITANNIAANTITAAQIATDTITANQIAANTITASEILANTITAAQIASNTITANNILSNTITSAQIASNTITANNILSNTITSAQIASNTITANNILSNTITSAQIAANTITANNILSNTITSLQIAANTINANNILSNTITSLQIAANTINANNILSNTITANEIASNTITAGEILANTITANEIASNTITADELAINVVQVGNTISSNNYSANTIGWQIRSNGSAEFNNNVTIKGKITASAISGSSINIGTGVFPVRVASTVNIAIASALTDTSTIDGVVVATGDRVLLKNQTAGAENGIYVVVASGAASRSTDADISAEVVRGMYVFISEGTVGAGRRYVLTTADPITLGTTSLTFTEFTGSEKVTGNVFSVSDNGSIIATSGTFSGALDIGGPDNDSLQVDTDGRLWIGHRSFDSAPFRVSSNGATAVGNGLVTIATTGATNVAGVLTVSNTANISGALNVTSTANISGNLTVGGTTINVGAVGSTTTIAGTLQVNSSTTVDGNLTVKGSTIVIGNSGGVSTTTLHGNTTVNGTVTISGTTIVNNTITLNGAITANGNITLSNNKKIDVGGGSVVGDNDTAFAANPNTVINVGYVLNTDGFKAYLRSNGVNVTKVIDLAERILISSGSAAAPSIAFVGDGDTGIYREGSNHIVIVTGGDSSAQFTTTTTTLLTPTTAQTTTLRAAATAFGSTQIAVPVSSRNLKKNIEEISNGLDIIGLLKPSTFEWKPLPSDTEFEASLRPFIRDFGFIAEEVAEANPRLACWKPNDIEGLTEAEKQHAINALDEWIPHYWSESGVIAVCVAAIKELKSRIEHLETELGYNS